MAILSIKNCLTEMQVIDVTLQLNRQIDLSMYYLQNSLGFPLFCSVFCVVYGEGRKMHGVGTEEISLLFWCWWQLFCFCISVRKNWYSFLLVWIFCSWDRKGNCMFLGIKFICRRCLNSLNRFVFFCMLYVINL